MGTKIISQFYIPVPKLFADTVHPLSPKFCASKTGIIKSGWNQKVGKAGEDEREDEEWGGRGRQGREGEGE